MVPAKAALGDIEVTLIVLLLEELSVIKLMVETGAATLLTARFRVESPIVRLPIGAPGVPTVPVVRVLPLASVMVLEALPLWSTIPFPIVAVPPFILKAPVGITGPPRERPRMIWLFTVKLPDAF